MNRRTSSRVKTRGQIICDLAINKYENDESIEKSSEIQITDISDTNKGDVLEPNSRIIQESPLPINFNESEINDLFNIIGDEVFASTDNTNNVRCEVENLSPSSSETPHPSPNCSINHLDYDCDNHFCPYFIEKENLVILEPLSHLSSIQLSELSQSQPNTPLSCISNNSSTITSNARSRKDKGNLRKRHVTEWIDVKRKNLRNLGKEYITRKGMIKPRKIIGPPCTCRNKCFNKINNEQRMKIFKSFWDLGDRNKQWTYVSNLVTKIKKRRVYTDVSSRRQYTLQYKLPVFEDETSNNISVCKKQFLNTLSVSEQFVYTSLEKVDLTTGTLIPDQRGLHKNHPRKITQSVKDSVCDHIKSLKPIESHYKRQKSSKLYLDGELNFHKLFEMYKEWLQTHDMYHDIAQTERQYRDIVNQNFKIGFFIPKKDQCDQCHIYKHLENPSENQKLCYEKHVANKNLSRQLKLIDKTSANESNGKIVTATFDFQKILNSPHGQMSVLYYKRKLSVFNFTLFDLSKKEGWCYMWHEGEGKRGANDVSSCLLNFITKMYEKGAREFRFWSDNCTGQNRNRIVFASYMYAAHKYNITIKHTFLEKGHTQAEGDSVHALIERSSKNKLIYTPLEWFSLVRWAKQDGKPYNVIEMKHSDFYDFKLMLNGRNWTKNITGHVVQWSKVKEVRVCSGDPFKIEYKYDLSADAYMIIAVNSNTRSSRRCGIADLSALYRAPLPISKSKKDDLISLCDSGIIPVTYHDFYKSLPSVANSESHDSE